jgi:hypothetical protein
LAASATACSEDAPVSTKSFLKVTARTVVPGELIVTVAEVSVLPVFLAALFMTSTTSAGLPVAPWMTRFDLAAGIVTVSR